MIPRSTLAVDSVIREHFTVSRPEVFSGALVPYGNGAVIVENDAHPSARRRSTMGHELAHVFGEHKFGASLVNERGCRLADQAQEDEAAEIAGELLVPFEAAKVLVGYGFGGRCLHAPLITSAPEREPVGVLTSSPERQALIGNELPGVPCRSPETVRDGLPLVARGLESRWPISSRDGSGVRQFADGSGESSGRQVVSGHGKQSKRGPYVVGNGDSILEGLGSAFARAVAWDDDGYPRSLRW